MSVFQKGHRPGLYWFGGYMIERVKSDGEPACWQITNQAGTNWITNTRTLHEARAYLAETVERIEECNRLREMRAASLSAQQAHDPGGSATETHASVPETGSSI